MFPLVGVVGYIKEKNIFQTIRNIYTKRNPYGLISYKHAVSFRGILFFLSQKDAKCCC